MPRGVHVGGSDQGTVTNVRVLTHEGDFEFSVIGDPWTDERIGLAFGPADTFAPPSQINNVWMLAEDALLLARQIHAQATGVIRDRGVRERSDEREDEASI